jgi:hypothetical protein
MIQKFSLPENLRFVSQVLTADSPMFAAEIRKKRIMQMRGYPRWRWHLDGVSRTRF